MTAQILQFPCKQLQTGYKIPLYTDDEIFITIMAINTFSNLKEKITTRNLSKYDPVIIIRCLTEAKESVLFSKETKLVINTILKSIEKVEIRL
ncbi:MAG: hypothetical protein EB127_10785 [Alphaproteobacteria bacterium]|nr:hypothetical protein [Alphaproteobacteria bacterium]